MPPQEELSPEEYQKPRKAKSGKSKYLAVKTLYNGVVYDSKQEAHRAQELDTLVLAGEIHSWYRQISFDLHVNSIKIGKYIADFLVIGKDGKAHLEETKGVLTPIASRSIKHFRAEYPELELRVLYAKKKK